MRVFHNEDESGRQKYNEEGRYKIGVRVTKRERGDSKEKRKLMSGQERIRHWGIRMRMMMNRQ